MCNPFWRCFFAAIVSIFPYMNNHVSTAEAASCRGSTGKLGVHRTVNLNTTGGARFGSSHGGHKNFLNAKEVVLTFDDGPNPSTTNEVLHALEQHCAKATFFMVGSMVRANASTAKRVAAKGHTIGIHSDTHKNLGRLNANSAITDVDKSIVSISGNVGSHNVARFFRFPYLSENKSVNRHLARKHYGVFAIDVDSLDYRISNPNSLVNRIMSQLRQQGNKGIILMHDTKKVTAKATGLLLNRLHAEGYRLVHIKGRSGGQTSDPVVVASADNIEFAETKDGPLLVARTDTRTQKRSQAIKRPTVAKLDEKQSAKSKPISVTSSRSDKKKKKIQVASLQNSNKRKPIKKQKVSKKQKAKPPKKKAMTLKQRQKAFMERRKKAIAKINTRNKAFREAMRARFITQ